MARRRVQSEPVEGLRTASELLLIMGSAPLVMQKAAPTREAAEQYADRTLARMVVAAGVEVEKNAAAI